MAELERRTLLKGSIGVAALGASAVALKYGFNTPDQKQDPSKCFAKDQSATDKRLVYSNWPEYIDEDDKGYTSTLTQFEKDTGIKVRYTADVNDNNEFFAKVKNQLGTCSSSKRDLFALTDWMAARMIQVGWIQKLDPSKVPNLHANIIDSLAKPEWDPKRDYSAPWQSGLTGIAYNKKKVGEIKSFSDLITRKDLKGRVSLLTEMRDTMGFMLLIDGADPENFTDSEWQKALDRLKKAKGDGQFRSFTGNDYVQDLAAGNVLACEAWSGDIANAGDDNLVWVPPEEGIIIWADNMLIPNLATHKANAEEWINYYYEPEVAAKLADYNSYICPVKGAQEAMEKVNPDNVHNELIFPTEKTLSQTHRFMALDEAQMRTYEGDFADVTGA
ncbi:ABC transporter substrate-binding protein [Aeromicrobium sp. Root236]|uniref:polyamine ABC transporter substrate-binding protein n=1 Tax=Aeromicrobium sp. Root236 TaxID=1736498 RepID=UPI0006F4F16C|nr:spermidine/putrescine ABC transporter substrate-binding protein [Aeromicrobium sp. Root236]KRC64171.1 ABC transporter substrate-binding protein [Aeromicrobium sp. Root236]